MLLTEFMVLATAGATIDGREIEEQWLKDIAETYDKEKYTAVINADHFEWSGNFGLVHEVKLGESKDGKLQLLGRINPNHRLILMNREGQRLFFSIEIIHDFAGTNKCYLTGLAMTDKPASLGTGQLKFTRENQNHTFSKTEPQELESNYFDLPLPGEEDHKEKDLFKKFKKWLSGSDHTDSKNPEDTQEDETMTPEQYQALLGKVDTVFNKVEDLSGKFAKMAEQSLNDNQEEQEPGKKPGDDQQEDKFTQLEAKITKLTETVSSLTQEKPGKFSQEDHQGDSESEDCI